MTDVTELITENLDLWTSDVQKKNGVGRGSSKKLDLYGIKKLRELILELAVRGKLVPQNPADEPASVLLDKISSEKEQLVKEKKIKKQKALPAISDDEIPFIIPKGWAAVRIGSLFDSITSGGTPNKNNPTFWDGTIPWASVKDLNQDKYISETQDYISETGLEEGSKLSEVGDFLICTRMGLGKIAITTKPIAFNQDLKAVTLSKYMNSDYFYSTYSTLKIRGTGTTVAGIKQEQLLNYVIGLPPLQEQHRIIKKVDELMALCDLLEQQTEESIDAHQTLVETLLGTLTQSQGAEELEQNWNRIAEHFDILFTTEESIDLLKQTILQLAVMGKLVPQNPDDEPASVLLDKIAVEKERLIKEKKIKKQKALPVITDDEKPFKLPDGWGFAHMQDICILITDGTHQTPKYTETGRPFISAQCVKPFKFMPEKCRFVSEEHYQDYIKNRNPEYKDILLSRVGAGIGEAALINTNLEFAIYVSTGLLKIFKQFIHPEYIVLWLNSPEGRGFSERYTLGKGVSQGNLNLSLIRSFLVSIPPYNEQLSIVSKVDELITLCDQLNGQMEMSQITKSNFADAIMLKALDLEQL